MSSRIAQASLRWNEDGLPWSLDYGDIYFSRADALGESSHVFLDGNSLRERFGQLVDRHFIIGELGFGTGLNFLNTCRLWQSHAPENGCLHYVACELHPMSRADLQRWHALFPDLADWRDLLLEQYAGDTAGVHQMQLSIANHRVILTLLLGDALTMLGAIQDANQFVMDAWYMDGFAPRLNPGLWEPGLCRCMARMSKPGTTLSSYSVAGGVRSALQEAGFQVHKQAGFAEKREMLAGTYPASAPATPQSCSRSLPVYIVGGGLAGCSTAFALAQSGIAVVLLEKEPSIASQGSGNPQGILHFRPVKRLAPDHHFNLQAYLHASRYYRALAVSHGLAWHPCGHLQLSHDARQAQRFEDIVAEAQYAESLLQLLDRENASALAGIPLQQGGLFFPDSGWLSPPALCRLYLQHPLITVHTGLEVEDLQQQDGCWRISASGVYGKEYWQTDNVVLCNSADVFRFSQTRHLPLISNRGQVDIHATASESNLPRTVVCGQSYLIPGSDGVQSLGGSYFLGGHSHEEEEERSAWHLQKLAVLSPAHAAGLARTPVLQRRIASRSITPDRLPLVGELQAAPGIWLNAGHGSHGLTRTPFCAALLASLLNATPPPMSTAHLSMLHPDRYPL